MEKRRKIYFSFVVEFRIHIEIESSKCGQTSSRHPNASHQLVKLHVHQRYRSRETVNDWWEYIDSSVNWPTEELLNIPVEHLLSWSREENSKLPQKKER